MKAFTVFGLINLFIFSDSKTNNNSCIRFSHKNFKTRKSQTQQFKDVKSICNVKIHTDL